MIGVVTRVKAKVDMGSQAPKYLRCVKLVRAPTEADRKAIGTLSTKDVLAWRHGKTAGEDADSFGEELDQEVDELDNAENAGDIDEQADDISRVSPQWTSDRFAGNLLFRLADEAGPSGISSMASGAFRTVSRFLLMAVIVGTL